MARTTRKYKNTRKKSNFIVIPKKQTGNLKEIDYKNLNLLRTHIMESGRIIPSRISGASAHRQRLITKSIKLARFLALLPYTDQQTR